MRLHALCFLTLGLCYFVACRDIGKTPKDTLVIGIESEIKNLDVRLAADANTGHLAFLLNQTLIQVNDKFLPEPNLAESFEDIGSKKFIFKIPNDVKFHDGTPLTVKDIVYSFTQAASPKSTIRSSFANVESFDAPNSSTFVVTLKKPNASFLLNELAAVRIFPEHLAEKPDYLRHPVGSGPYRFVERKARDLIFERFDAYQSYRRRKGLEPLPFKYIIVRAIEDPTTRFLSLAGGDIDALFNALSPQRLIEIKDIPNLSIYQSEGTTYQYIGLNQKSPKFHDVRVRHALAMAINRKEIIEYKLKGFALPAAGLLPPQNPFTDASLAQVNFDPEGARRLLKEAKAENLEIELKCSSDRDVVSVLQIIQKNWQDVGLKVQLRPADFATFFAEIRKGNFESFSLRWTGVTEPDILFKVFHSSELPPGRNRISYSNPSLDAWLEKARLESNFAKRKELYAKAQKIIAEDSPYISLWYPADVAVIAKTVKDFKLSANGSWQGILSAHKEGESL